MQVGLHVGRDTRVLFMRLSPVPIRDRCKLPADLHVVPSFQARLGCPVARCDASCRSFFAGLEVLLPPPSLPPGMVFCCITHLTLCTHMLMPSMLSPGAQSLLHSAALQLFSISLVSPVPQGESPVASWGCCCSQMLDWLSPWQGQIPAHGNGCNKSCWGLAGVSD